MFQWMPKDAADYASVTNIFFLGASMPETVPASAIKFYEDRFVNLCGLPRATAAKTAYLAVRRDLPPPISRLTRSMPAARAARQRRA